MQVALDHIGVVVRDLAEARRLYEGLGIEASAPELVPSESARVAMVPLEGGRIELLEATAEDSVLGRFLARRGEGLHHVALRVESVDREFARLQAEGVRLASGAVRVGAGGHRYFFVHPEAANGVLLEIVGA